MAHQDDEIVRLVLAQVERTWREIRENTGDLGPPPTALIVQQCATARWDRAECTEPVVRGWVHDAGGTTERPPSPSELAGVSVARGICNEVGRVWFHIGQQRDHVIFTYMVGPRYGRGMILRVAGEHLEIEPFPQWVS